MDVGNRNSGTDRHLPHLSVRACLALGCLACVTCALAANGDLDPSFGAGGIGLAGLTDALGSLT